MKKIVTVLFLLILGLMTPSCLLPTSPPAQAMFAQYTDADLVQSSPLIVNGKFLGETHIILEKDQINLNLGIIQIDEVLKGDSAKFVLLALPRNAHIVSEVVTYHAGQKGLWFLQPRMPEETGIYRADHPQRFLSEATGEQIDHFRQLTRP
jgi:hypothetical protein